MMIGSSNSVILVAASAHENEILLALEQFSPEYSRAPGAILTFIDERNRMLESFVR